MLDGLYANNGRPSYSALQGDCSSPTTRMMPSARSGTESSMTCASTAASAPRRALPRPSQLPWHTAQGIVRQSAAAVIPFHPGPQCVDAFHAADHQHDVCPIACRRHAASSHAVVKRVGLHRMMIPSRLLCAKLCPFRFRLRLGNAVSTAVIVPVRHERLCCPLHGLYFACCAVLAGSCRPQAMQPAICLALRPRPSRRISW